MPKKKYNSITFHRAADQIVEKYCGKIPNFELETINKIRTNKEGCEQIFMLSYEHVHLPSSKVNFHFFICKDTPEQVLTNFEKNIRSWFFPDESITTDELIPFDYPF